MKLHTHATVGHSHYSLRKDHRRVHEAAEEWLGGCLEVSGRAEIWRNWDLPSFLSTGESRTHEEFPMTRGLRQMVFPYDLNIHRSVFSLQHIEAMFNELMIWTIVKLQL